MITNIFHITYIDSDMGKWGLREIWNLCKLCISGELKYLKISGTSRVPPSPVDFGSFLSQIWHIYDHFSPFSRCDSHTQ